MTHTHEPEYLMIPTEDGKEEKFEILYLFEHDETGKSYIFVIPADDGNNEESYQEVLAFRYKEEDNGDLTLEMIDEENQVEWDMVEEVFNTLVSEMEEGNVPNEQ